MGAGIGNIHAITSVAEVVTSWRCKAASRGMVTGAIRRRPPSMPPGESVDSQPDVGGDRTDPPGDG